MGFEVIGPARGASMVRLIDTHLGRLRRMLIDMSVITWKAIEYIEMVSETGSGSMGDIDDISMRSSLLRDEAVDLAMETIARFQPVAKDLRWIRAAMEVSYDFYRITRYCREFVRTSEKVGDGSCRLTRVKAAFHIVRRMMKLVREMLIDFKENLAREVFKLDDEVDFIYLSSLDSLSVEGAYVPKCAAVEVLLLRHLERMADHATYIVNALEFAETGRAKEV